MAIATKTPGFVSVAATLPITGEMTVKTTVLSIAKTVIAIKLTVPVTIVTVDGLEALAQCPRLRAV
eukprot:CAMPEP_0185017166 /NCGR_PEP_ID=MMETSP1103-20130426/129_1 /TAXON_ID=36769 /ORGANISM="Paraphysomonas bandaiensis, Strain Caron Lab Isolate" /LENGTH=65 /DNA_ID=CAMNT_0027546447 /DNA_START=236 /DNA_END=433 /DNA_ORIENTATION=+